MIEVIFKKSNNDLNFSEKTWEEFKNGFGDINNFNMGLENLH